MLTALLFVGLPAQAIGTYGPGGNERTDFAARAVMIQDQDSIVAAVQIDPEAAQLVTHWIIPVPGVIEIEPQKITDEELEDFLAASDPMYLASGGASSMDCSTGCVESVADTGELSKVRLFDPDIAASGSTIRIFRPSEMSSLIAAAQQFDIALGDEGMGIITNYGAMGWSVVMIDLANGVSWDKAAPLLVYRYSGTEMVVPMALSRNVARTELQTLVTVVAPDRMEPAKTRGVEPKLGIPAYRPQMTRKFYNARVRVAIEEAGGRAWVLEYANTLEALAGRHRSLESNEEEDNENVIASSWPENPMGLVDSLASEGYLSMDYGQDAFVTRWRTYAAVADLEDEPFRKAKSNEVYDVYIDSHRDRVPQQGGFVLPFLAMGWLMRRRRE